jgi:hypothetical protein
MTEYALHVIDRGEITMVVRDDFKDAVDALYWAHFLLGFYRSDSVRVYKAEGEPESARGKLIAEITPPDWTLRAGHRVADMNPEISVGSLAVAKRNSGVCSAGEVGVCYEIYQRAMDGQLGYSFIFECGRYDGFSPEEVTLILDLTGGVCEAVAGYQFKNVVLLERDFHAGRFAAAFPQYAGQA